MVACKCEKENFIKWIGLKTPVFEGKWHYTLLITVASVLVYGVLTTLVAAKFAGEVTTAGSQFAGKGAAAIPVIIAYGFIRTGLAEEVVFRGFLLKRISSGFGFIVGNTIQAFVFGCLHGIPFGLVTGNIGVTVILTILPAGLGWFQGWLNEKRAGGSIVPSWIIHGIVNTIVAAFAI